ncbi:class I SAM-dependent methyltransferase [Mycobacterium sp.]|uniref:class I SAM-dependent methyltransferase n=1 Tax=Mycobacterium sp. TaxID=1785 RepID=UPI0012801D96|nr:class I SAM-dependent methyltransferase [Mycobacterium sp.]KAA8958644.1 MAG: class I SAM-dependent methyltransferase [Mycobacterium sp.]
MDRTVPNLGEVGETLLIPLYARACDAAARRPVLGDRRARELVAAIDYDFTRFGGSSLSGSVFRSSIFDAWVRGFVDDHPAGTVVELGTGLNTRFDRLDNGRIHWFDLDLPDAIALRRRFFRDSQRCRMLAGSVLDTDWYDVVAAAPGPYLFISEAVLIYLSADAVHRIFGQLSHRFPGSLIAFDTAGTRMVANQDRNRSLAQLTARLQWVCDNPRDIERWGLRLLDTRTLATPQPHLAATWPRSRRYGMAALARLAPAIVNTYKFNLCELAAPQ